MNMTETSFAKEMIRMCDDGWQQGWHECHGGNLSYRLSEADLAEAEPGLERTDDWKPIGVDVTGLGGDLFMVTAAGQIFRNTKEDPERSLGIIEISADGKMWRRVWGYAGGGRPTSELPAHLANHEVIKARTNGRNRIVYHAHPENIVALSFVLPLTDEIFTRELWEMMPECAMTFPSGMGVIKWMVPGTPEIAKVTMEKMKLYDIVLWAQHGVFATGPDPDAAFGLVHTVEKSASMLMKVLAVRPEKRSVVSVAELKAMAEVFHLDLPERFLYEKA